MIDAYPRAYKACWASPTSCVTSLVVQLRQEARGVSASSSSSASSATSTVDLRTFLLTLVCPKYTAAELKTNYLDNVMHISTLIVKL
jgi:hypothetical protein